MPAPKVGGVGYGLPAAIALTEPSRAVALVLGTFYDDESPESLSSQIHDMRRGESSAVPHLLAGGGPANIAGLVVPVVVDPVNRVLGPGTGADVLIEGREVVQPLVADFDAARSVVDRHLRVRIAASLSHRTPSVVFGRAMHAVGGGWGRLATSSLRREFARIAPARRCRAVAKIAASSDGPSAAVADAGPRRAISQRSCAADHQKATEASSGHVYRGHGRSITVTNTGAGSAAITVSIVWIRTE
jgi:hypothetical protein